MLHHRTVFASLFTLAILALQLPASAAQGGLSSWQLAQLRRLGFAVVPQEPPAGFRAESFKVDPARRTYRIVYRGPGGATITIYGAPLKGKGAPTRPASQPHGLFQRLAGALKGFKGVHSDANSNNGQANEEEEEMTAVSADSQVLGPVYFQNERNCLAGDNDPAKARIHDAQFRVYGCNMRHPDALIRTYRSLQSVPH